MTGTAEVMGPGTRFAEGCTLRGTGPRSRWGKWGKAWVSLTPDGAPIADSAGRVGASEGNTGLAISAGATGSTAGKLAGGATGVTVNTPLT